MAVTQFEKPDDSETIVVLDFGAQYSQLIARRVREVGVRTLIVPSEDSEALNVNNLRGIILSGGPTSVYQEGAPQLQDSIMSLGVPILGICYGMQLLSHSLGGTVTPADDREFGPARAKIVGPKHEVFRDVPNEHAVSYTHLRAHET